MDKVDAGWIADSLRRGLADLNAGRTRPAARHCRAVLERAPRSVQAHFLTGLIAIELGDRRNAVSAFGTVTQLEPRHSAAWAHLGRLFVLAGQAARAEKAVREAVRHGSRDPVVQDLIGTVHSLLGEQEAACSWYARAVRGNPAATPPRLNYANSLLFNGDMRAARAQLDVALRSAPTNAQAHWLLASARRAEDRSHVETMAGLAARRDLPARAAAFLHYAIGKELEDLEDWSGAFGAFSRGAAARRRTVDYDEALEVAAFDAAGAVFSADWFAAAAEGVGDTSPIFVVGQPRTGTTLVDRVIASHSAVHSAGELQQFGLAVRRLTRSNTPGRFNAGLVEGAARVDPQALGTEYLRATRRSRREVPRFVDKLPTNYLYLPLIAKALPRAKVVHIVRDPRDACFASFKQLFANAYPHSYEQGEMARHFVRYHRMMAAWRHRCPGCFYDVVYEDLVTDLETEARALLDYLELPWEDACLRFHEHRGAVATASAAQVREPAHTRSVGRWRRYGSRLKPMLDALSEGGVV